MRAGVADIVEDPQPVAQGVAIPETGLIDDAQLQRDGVAVRCLEPPVEMWRGAEVQDLGDYPDRKAAVVLLLEVDDELFRRASLCREQLGKPLLVLARLPAVRAGELSV